MLERCTAHAPVTARHGSTFRGFASPTVCLCPPLQVRITPKKGKAILISGHDLQDTHDLLEQTEGKGERCMRKRRGR